MRVFNVKKLVMGATALTALIGLGMGAASATPTEPSFQITPSSVGSAKGPFTATDIQGPSNGLIHQTGATTQVESGYLQVATFLNQGNIVNNTGLLSDWGLYLDYTAKVTGIGGFGPGNQGNINPGDFTFAMYADVGNNDSYTPASVCDTAGCLTGPTGATVGSTTGDVVLAVGYNVTTGNAGFQSTGGPIFGTTSAIILCDGTAGEGVLSGVKITNSATAACGTFDATTFFTAPVPFYNVQFATATTASTNNLDIGNGASTGYASLDGITATINFAQVPEPISISLFGAGLVGAAFARRRKAKKA